MSDYTHNHCYKFRSQKGAALIVSLMILIIISVLGISAMKTSMFQAKLSTSMQASEMTFRAAESAINSVFAEAVSGDANNPLYMALSSSAGGVKEIQYRCLKADDMKFVGDCSGVDRMDSRGLVVGKSRTIFLSRGSEGGSQISRAGGMATGWFKYEFLTIGEGSMPSMEIENYNAQQFSTLGPDVGGEL